MSAEDDTRVVNMRINNKDFLSGTSQSLKALDTLNKGIDGAGKGKGMKNMAADVDTVRTRFGAMQIAGVTALANITNRAVNAGVGLIKSLTVSPIMDGWREYEKLLTSTQTIMANTGNTGTKGLRLVGTYLDDLNRYSDQTIYNFGEMADNIGRFTAAGVKLPIATTAIKGIANTAALAGSNTEQLNTAMYQMSQALATGTIKLMDWNSLSNAGMGGKNIQNALKETARTLSKDYGASIDASIKKNGSFRESLRDGWLTADVFTKTMKVMAGQTATAGASVKDLHKMGLTKLSAEAVHAGKIIKFTTKDLENLKANGFDKANIAALQAGKTVAFTAKQLQKMGYSKDAAERLSKLSAAAQLSATRIKTFSQLMDVLKESVGSGFAGIFRILFGNLNRSAKLWTTVGTAIQNGISMIFRGITSVLQTWEQYGGFQKFWAGVGNLFKAAGNLLAPFVALFRSLLPASDGAGTAMVDLTRAFWKFSIWLEKVTSGATGLNPVFSALGSVIKFVFGVIGAYIGSMFDLLMLFAPLAKAIGGLVGAVFSLADGLLSMMGISTNLSGAFSSFETVRASILTPFIATLTTIVEALTSLINGDISFDQFKKTFAGAFSGLGDDIGDMFGVGKRVAGDMIAGLKAGIDPGSINDTISGWVENFTSFFKGLLGIHSPSTVFEEYGGNIVQGLANGIKGAFSAISGAMGSLVSYLKENLQGLDKVDFANAFSVVFSVVAFGSIKRFMDGLGATMSTFKGFADDIRENVTGKNGILNQTTKTMGAMQNNLNSKAILNIAIALGILAVSLWVLSKIPAKEMAIGLGALTVMMGIMVVGMKLLSKVAMTMGKAVFTLIGLGAAMVLMGTGLLILAGAMYVFSKVIAVYAKMDWKTVGKGLGMLALTLVALGVALIPLALLAPGVLIASVALVVLSAAMMAVLGAIMVFEKIKFATLLNGVAKMAAVLFILGLALVPLAILAPGVLIAAAALVVLSFGLMAMLGVIMAFSKMDFGTFGKGLAMLAIALVAIGVASLVAAPGLILLGAAAVLLGAGLLAIGAGFALVGVGLALVGAAGIAAFTVLIAGVEMFVAALPVIGTQFIGAMDVILDALAAKAPAIVDHLVTILKEVFRGIRELAPDLADTAMVLITTLLDFLVEREVEFVKAGVELITGLIQGLTDSLPQLVEAIANFVVAMFNEFDSHQEEVINAGITFFEHFLAGVGGNTERMATAAGQAILDFLTAINEAVKTYTEPIVATGMAIAGNLLKGLILGLIPDGIQTAFMNLVNSIVDFFKGLLGINSPSTVFAGFGRNIVEGLGQGIRNAIGMATGAVGNLVSSVLGGIRGLPGKVGSALSGLGGILSSTLGGAFNKAVSVVNGAVTNIGAAIGKIPGLIRKGISSIGTAAQGIGKAIVDGIGHGVAKIGSWVSDLSGALKNAINGALGLPKRIGIKIDKGPIHISTGVTIPAFAKGTDYFRPRSGAGAALVGEAGPELVSMNKGSSVITNKNLEGFVKSVSSITKTLLSRVNTTSTNTAGQINYVVGANFQGDPKASGTAFAANIVAGLVGGLQANQSAANSAMTNLANTSTQSFADTLGIHSPSTVFASLAKFAGQGFVNGLVASTAAIINASRNLANAGLGEISRAVGDGVLQFEVSKAFGDAYTSAAELVRKRAEKADKKGKGGKSKSGDREAKRLNRDASALEKQAKRNAATAERRKAANEANEVAIKRAAELAKAYKDNDLDKVADMKKEDALNVATAASGARQKAIELRKEASLVAKYDKARAKKLRDQATKYEKEAKRLGAAAGAAASEAVTAANNAAQAQQDKENKEAADAAAALTAQLTTVTSEMVTAAQKTFDQSRQLTDAQAAAATDVIPQVTYEQNLYSPEALSPSEVYRQSKNLLSMTEKKLVGAPS
jgi:tape measure domain-containing protein